MRYYELMEDSQKTITWSVPAHDKAAVTSGEKTVVWVDVQAIDQAWSQDHDFHVGPNGSGSAIKGRYERFGNWQRDNLPVEMSEMVLDHHKRPFFENGRHRFAWLRDHGAQAVPVVVPTEQAEELKKTFGASTHKTTIRLSRDR